MASTVTLKNRARGNRGIATGRPSNAKVGVLPYGAVTGGQDASDPVAKTKATQDKNRKAIGYGEH